jgi:hypothetical protein
VSNMSRKCREVDAASMAPAWRVRGSRAESAPFAPQSPRRDV